MQRNDNGLRQQIRGDNPGEALDIAELGNDGRKRGRDDRRVERREKHRKDEAGKKSMDAHACRAFHVWCRLGSKAQDLRPQGGRSLNFANA